MKVCLVGLMGCGKSTVGELLANKLKLPFIDLDVTFETKYHMEIHSFFERFGEDKFREFETKLLEELLQRDHFILSTGGGTPCFNNNMELIKKNATSVYINLPAEVICKRLHLSHKKRPIIKDIHEDDLLAYVNCLAKIREPYYRQANYVVHTDGTNPLKTTKMIYDVLMG